MDGVTRLVRDMYAQFPYPSPQARARRLRELASLFKIFWLENKFDFAGKRVLDAGTGTGQRLIEAAKAFPKTHFVAVDISENSLMIAREAAANEGVENIDFAVGDLMAEQTELGTFDIVLAMGVIHHLSDPARGLRNLVQRLNHQGIMFLYFYGREGSRERMRKKQIVSLLLNGRAGDFTEGIRIIRQLGFAATDYGWNMNFDDEESQNSLLVDAYLNVHETLFDAAGIATLMQRSGLAAYMTYGITCGQRGSLFDTRCLTEDTKPALETTGVAAQLGTDELRQRYDRLSLAEKYRFIDLWFQPNGYTVLGMKEGALDQFPPAGRVRANLLEIPESVTA